MRLPRFARNDKQEISTIPLVARNDKKEKGTRKKKGEMKKGPGP
jgi:hypothetical protein